MPLRKAEFGRTKLLGSSTVYSSKRLLWISGFLLIWSTSPIAQQKAPKGGKIGWLFLRTATWLQVRLTNFYHRVLVYGCLLGSKGGDIILGSHISNIPERNHSRSVLGKRLITLRTPISKDWIGTWNIPGFLVVEPVEPVEGSLKVGPLPVINGGIAPINGLKDW